MSVVMAIRARCHAGPLDAALRAGANPDDSPELRARAGRLTAPAFRAALATRLEDAVRYPGACPLLSAAVTMPRALALAGPAVLDLARALRATAHPRPRGVALALWLVADGGSPLYTGPTSDDVVREADAAREAL